MKNYKLIKTVAAVALGASVITAALVPGSTSAFAASKYKVSKGKLVNAKTGKIVKGYVVYNSKLYYNGKLKTGYKTVGTGKSIKLYYNGSLKKGYKTAKENKLLFYNGSLKKGYKTAGNGERLYKDGYLDKGYEVYGDVENNPSLYYNGYLKSGYKTANNATLMFYNGKLSKGYKTDKNGTVLYNEGRLNKGFVKVEDKFYNDAELANGTFEYKGKEVAVEKGVEVGAKVKEVKAVNGSTLEITFNKSIDKEDAENAVVTLAGNSLSKGTLSEDGHVLKILDSKINNVKNATLEVPAIKTKADTKISTPKYVTVFSYKDTVAPTVLDTEQLSSTKVKVKFSEPVAAFNNFTFEYADGKAVDGVVSPEVKVGDTEAIFDLSDSNVETGKTIKVTAIGLKDVAGNIINPNPTTFEITKLKVDGVKPLVNSISQTGAKTFEVTFSKAVKVGEGIVAVTGNTVSKVETKTKDATSDTTLVVTAEKVLDGVQNVSISGFADIDNQAIDNTTKVVTFAKDEVAPSVTTSKLVKVNGKENIELTFDKAVTAGEVKVTGSYVKDYVTTDLTEKAVTAVYPEGDKSKKVLLVPVASFASVDGAKYEVKINSEEIKSDAEQQMKEATASFTRGKDDAASVENDKVFTKSDITVEQGNNPSEVTVTFNDEVDGASATNTDNYSIEGAVVESASLAPVKDDSSQVVTLKLKANSNTFTGIRNITVSNVKVKNSTSVMEDAKFTNVSLAENVAATLKSVKLIANNQVEVTFSENVTNPTEVKLFAGSEEVKNVTASASDKVVTIKLPEGLALTADQLKAGLKVNVTVKDINNNETKIEKAADRKSVV